MVYIEALLIALAFTSGVLAPVILFILALHFTFK